MPLSVSFITRHSVVVPTMLLLLLLLPGQAWLPTSRTLLSSPSTTSRLEMILENPGYTPKWKKKKTLAEELATDGPTDFVQRGLQGDVTVVFRQRDRNVTSSETVAFVGQPLRDVASQAGQYIKYGCLKGECGTCACQLDGQWVRPCVAVVPPAASRLELVTPAWQTADKVSSGKFYSVKSFFRGFWNNLLGMVGFVQSRRRARDNWRARQEYEDLIAQKTAAKKAAKSHLQP